jgi:hypothetical protein
MLQKPNLFWILVHITAAELPPKIYLKVKYKNKNPNWIYEYTKTAEMASKTNQIKLNWIHGYTTTAEMVPKTNQMRSNWIHTLNIIIELLSKTYQTIMSENIKLNWIRCSHEHTSRAKMAPKSNQINVLEAIKLENMKPNWIHEHTTTAETAPKSNQIILLETLWIHDHSTSAKLASRSKKHIINPNIEMVLNSFIRIVPECFLIHYSATTKRRNMKMINNTRSLTLSLFLFMTNFPTMSIRRHLNKTGFRPDTTSGIILT